MEGVESLRTRAVDKSAFTDILGTAACSDTQQVNAVYSGLYVIHAQSFHGGDSSGSAPSPTTE